MSVLSGGSAKSRPVPDNLLINQWISGAPESILSHMNPSPLVEEVCQEYSLTVPAAAAVPAHTQSTLLLIIKHSSPLYNRHTGSLQHCYLMAPVKPSWLAAKLNRLTCLGYCRNSLIIGRLHSRDITTGATSIVVPLQPSLLVDLVLQHLRGKPGVVKVICNKITTTDTLTLAQLRTLVVDALCCPTN